ncbi:peptidylprolyl isomerase [Bacterioplanoides sp. SCSIO 12839]|uniref:peptidylprolyl isomerase n=1 Tax=Bacterioplanoides sp. SCSIO 12839 TaxID=2829569 RepID=UPI002106805E|nr:peptidylprolyl isomerase [Bacterioplanoides sp. SCSIO 12839]UTW49305.1 peptidylprolyl isomerase [Bacterioplanoides sp. SCSIO 12839]
MQMIEIPTVNLDDNNQPEEPNTIPDILVNGTAISEAQILAEMQYHPADNQRDATIAAAEALVIIELIKQRCEQLGIKTDDGSELTDDQMLAELMQREVQVPAISDEECQRYFTANPDKFITSPILEVDHILLAADKEDLDQRAEAKELADGLLEQIQQQPQLFSDFAMRHSMCPSKEQGGSLGQISKGQTVPEFEKVLFLAEEGLLNRPVETRYGYHIARINRRIEGQLLEFDQVEEKIKTYLNEKVHRKALAQYIELLISDAEIEGFEFQVSDSPLVQ